MYVISILYGRNANLTEISFEFQKYSRADYIELQYLFSNRI